MEKPDILSMNPAELEELVISLGEKKFRAAQLWSWMQKGASLDEMTNLPKSFREKLASQTSTACRDRAQIRVKARRDGEICVPPL